MPAPTTTRLRRRPPPAAALTSTGVDEVDDTGQHVGVDLGQHAMPEVEDVGWRSPAGLEDGPHLNILCGE